MMKKLGLKYMPVKKRKRNMNNFRPERIRKFIISYDDAERSEEKKEKYE